MNWKEFFKPNIISILLPLIHFLGIYSARFFTTTDYIYGFPFTFYKHSRFAGQIANFNVALLIVDSIIFYLIGSLIVFFYLKYKK